MCDCLVALAPATAAGVTLFAKNSDRPPSEVQDVVWAAPRRDGGPLRCTWIDVDPHASDTFGLALEQAPSAASAVAVIADAIERYGQGGSGHRDVNRPYWSSFLVVDPRSPIGTDELVEHLRSHDGGDDGWTVFMHVDGVEQTTASLVAELPVDGPAVAWCSLGSPCEGSFSRVVVGDAVPASLGPQRGGST